MEDIAIFCTAVASLFAAFFVGWQIRKMSEAIKQTKGENQHRLCFDIWKEYNTAFSDRQDLMINPIRLGDVKNKYSDITEFINSDEYKKLRRVAAVYGMTASLIKTGAIDEEIIFNYISVPPKLWNDNWPVIAYLRENYYNHLFEGWESLYAAEHNNWNDGKKGGKAILVSSASRARQAKGRKAR